MDETLFEKIEQYLNDGMSKEERLSFESEMAINEELASTVKLYNAIDTEMSNHEKYKADEAALKNTLKTLNATYFKQQQKTEEGIIPVKKNASFRWIYYAVAASITIIAALFFLDRTSLKQLAKNYVAQNATKFSLTISHSANDTLQAGIDAYNKRDYSIALQLFRSYYGNHPQSSSVIQYIGFVYLVTNKYDSAFHEFDELSNIKDLYNNPGIFLKAVTLLLRNEKKDHDQAKPLLRQVAEQRLEGSRQAKEWLKRF